MIYLFKYNELSQILVARIPAPELQRTVTNTGSENTCSGMVSIFCPIHGTNLEVLILRAK
jgi:hypothetical protein